MRFGSFGSFFREKRVLDGQESPKEEVQELVKSQSGVLEFDERGISRFVMF